jgi:hypothetical protein
MRAYGVWPAMLEAAGGLEGLGDQLFYGERWLLEILAGRQSPWGVHRRLAERFGARHNIKSKVYHLPSTTEFLISSPSGWWKILPYDSVYASITNLHPGHTKTNYAHIAPWEISWSEMVQILEGLTQ